MSISTAGPGTRGRDPPGRVGILSRDPSPPCWREEAAGQRLSSAGWGTPCRTLLSCSSVWQEVMGFPRGKRTKKTPNLPPQKSSCQAHPVRGVKLLWGIESSQTRAAKPSRCCLRRDLGTGMGTPRPCHPDAPPPRCSDGGFCPLPRGHRAYLSSTPHYDFPRYRQLVHEITVAFSGISREVLGIAGRLRDELARPDLAQHLARLQEREQEKLQLVSAELRGGGWGVSHHCPGQGWGSF